jgi:hypothetical protein
VVNITQRGDVNDDDRIDILDILRVVSHILERQYLQGEEFLRADVAPWPGGDGEVDIRDLALIQNIVLTNRYPDGLPVSKPGPPDGGDGVRESRPRKGSHPRVRALVRLGHNGMAVNLASEIKVMGLQIELAGFRTGSEHPWVTPGAFGTAVGRVSDGVLRVLAYDPVGSILDPGDHRIASLGFRSMDPGPVEGIGLILVGEDGARIQDVELVLSHDAASGLPEAFRLSQNYPNPFNPTTHISVSLPAPAMVTLVVYDAVGQEVRVLSRGEFTAGVHEIAWDGSGERGGQAAGGAYFYRLTAIPMDGGGEEFVQTKKMILLR